jgi:N-acyl-D-aspartate/D-glutamate deacylase
MYAQCMAVWVSQTFTLEDYNGLDTSPHWLEATVGTREQRQALLADPARRPGLRADMDETGRGAPDAWDKVRIVEVAEARNYPVEGRSVGALARERGCHPVDAFLDLAVDEGLRTRFAWLDQHVPSPEILAHPATHVSLSDGGAHTRYQTSGAWPTVFLAEWVRDRALLSIQDAVWKMSALPAWIAGFRDRGTLREGLAADIVVCDLEHLGLAEPSYAHDFPGDERRLVQKARGWRYTIVNGAVTLEESEPTGALSGRVLRSYDRVS